MWVGPSLRLFWEPKLGPAEMYAPGKDSLWSPSTQTPLQGGLRVSQGATRPQREPAAWRVASLNSGAFCCHLAPYPLLLAQGKRKGELNYSRQRGPKGEDHAGWSQSKDLLANGPGAGPPGRGAGI